MFECLKIKLCCSLLCYKMNFVFEYMVRGQNGQLNAPKQMASASVLMQFGLHSLDCFNIFRIM